MAKFNLTIGRRISGAFGIIILSTVIAFFLTNNTLNKSKELNDRINDVYNPSVANLEELNILTLKSRMYISNWVYYQSRPDYSEKIALQQLIKEEYPRIRQNLKVLSNNWQNQNKLELDSIFTQIDQMYIMCKDIMDQLNNFSAYEDASIVLFIRPSVEENGDIDLMFRKITTDLNSLISIQQELASAAIEKMNGSFGLLQSIVRYLGVGLVIFGILIALFTVNSIVKPVKIVRDALLKMGRGIVPDEIKVKRDDEIGDMNNALNILIDGTTRTTLFAEEVGAGNFDSPFQALSDEDQLGHTLLKMRVQLAENERILEQKVIERTEEVVRQKEEIEVQRKKLAYLFTQQTDSIKYAKRLQEAIMPPMSFVRQVLPESFVYFKPKDIVSGDFYWVEAKGSKVYFASVDCTGHGVPGAFMSLIGHNVLKQSLMKLANPTPAELMDELSRGIVATLHQGRTENTTKDGMDLTICSVDYDAMVMEFASAFNAVYFMHNGQLKEIKADKNSIGSFVADEFNHYTNHRIDLVPGDAIYILSDGYCDQFGGPKGKKFMAARWREMLGNIQDMSMDNQKVFIQKAIEDWRGTEEQIDDILVIGVRV